MRFDGAIWIPASEFGAIEPKTTYAVEQTDAQTGKTATFTAMRAVKEGGFVKFTPTAETIIYNSTPQTGDSGQDT